MKSPQHNIHMHTQCKNKVTQIIKQTNSSQQQQQQQMDI